MPGFYFERYMEPAARALESPSVPVERPDNGTLIQGIEDIGGEGRIAIARAVIEEGAMLAGLLREAGVRGRIIMERSPLIPVSGGDRLGNDASLERGWYLGKLVDGAPYMKDGVIGRETRAAGMLAEDGTIYAYSPSMIGSPEANGIALNRYAPACATSMNDRAMLFGMAIENVGRDLEFPRAS